MTDKLYVDVTTRGRVWLEAHSIPLPDPWAPEDIPVLIEQFYPGGRTMFLHDKAPELSKIVQDRRRWARNSRRYYEKHREAILAGKRVRHKW